MASTGGRREDNERVLRAYCDAWSRGDLAAIMGFYHDDVVLHWLGHGPLAGEHRGRAAALTALATLTQLANRTLLGVHDVLASDDHGVILARERFERAGRVLETNRVLLYHLADGKLREVWVYDEDQRAVDELLAAE